MSSGDTSGRYLPSAFQKPASISNLVERVDVGIGWNHSEGLTYWLSVAESYRDEGKRLLEQEGDYEGAFVAFGKAASLILSLMPKHPGWSTLTVAQKKRIITVRDRIQPSSSNAA